MEGFDLRNLLNPEHWLAMDSDMRWYVSVDKPRHGGWVWLSDCYCELDSMFFSLPRCAEWEESLIQVKDLIKD